MYEEGDKDTGLPSKWSCMDYMGLCVPLCHLPLAFLLDLGKNKQTNKLNCTDQVVLIKLNISLWNFQPFWWIFCILSLKLTLKVCTSLGLAVHLSSFKHWWVSNWTNGAMLQREISFLLGLNRFSVSGSTNSRSIANLICFILVQLLLCASF